MVALGGGEHGAQERLLGRAELAHHVLERAEEQERLRVERAVVQRLRGRHHRGGRLQARAVLAQVVEGARLREALPHRLDLAAQAWIRRRAHGGQVRVEGERFWVVTVDGC